MKYCEFILLTTVTILQNLIIVMKITPEFLGIILTAIGTLLLAYVLIVVVFSKKARS